MSSYSHTTYTSQKRTTTWVPTPRGKNHLASLAEDVVPIPEPVPSEPFHPRVDKRVRVHHEGVEVDQGAAVLAPLPPAVVTVAGEVNHLRLPRVGVVRDRLLKIEKDEQGITRNERRGGGWGGMKPCCFTLSVPVRQAEADLGEANFGRFERRLPPRIGTGPDRPSGPTGLCSKHRVQKK